MELKIASLVSSLVLGTVALAASPLGLAGEVAYFGIESTRPAPLLSGPLCQSGNGVGGRQGHGPTGGKGSRPEGDRYGEFNPFGLHALWA